MSLEEYRDEEAERKTSLQTGLPRRWCNVGSGALRSAAKASLRPRPPTHAHLLFDEPPLLEELPVLRQHALLGLHRHLRETRGGGVQKQSLSTSKSYQDTSEGRLFK